MIYGILAAVLFGISAPLAKLLLEGVDPLALAGLLYAGAGLALGLSVAGAKLFGASGAEARLDRKDSLWLAGAILTGGVAGPILLLLGLQRTAAATAALLLNFEVVATGVIALVVFHEFVGRIAWAAIAAVAIGGALLTVDPSGGWGLSPGVLLILAACVAWGFDNNFTARISLKDPRRIVAIKGLAAGALSLTIAAILGRPMPRGSLVLYALLLGAVSYGASISLFVLSLRRVGATRTGTLFGVAPFVGVALSLAVFRDVPQWTFFAALPLMALATLWLAREKHDHRHLHVGMTHTHRHRHDDDHHEHGHPGDPNVDHAHEHTHQTIEHVHSHRPDPHHRHEHEAS